MTQPSPHVRLPISVITGFLGAGESTLLGKLIQHADMDRVAVIVNEFGEVGIDHALVSKVDEETVLLNSGCLCCTVRGDLLDTLMHWSAARGKGRRRFRSGVGRNHRPGRSGANSAHHDVRPLFGIALPS